MPELRISRTASPVVLDRTAFRGPETSQEGHGCRWRGPFTGPAQARYANYFSLVLISPTLRQPRHLTKMLRQIVFSGLEGLNYRALTAAGSCISTSGKSEDVIPFLAGKTPFFHTCDQDCGGFAGG